MRARAALAAGADVRYVRQGGYDALIDAIHGFAGSNEEGLLDVMRWLIAAGVNLSGISRHAESGLRLLSFRGQFRGVRLLLEAGADEDQLAWTPLIRSVALGTLEDLQRVLATSPDLEGRDWWERTAWLVAVLIGDIEKASLLRSHGVNVEARGRCGRPTLLYAVAAPDDSILRWLLDEGANVDETDDFGNTALLEAVSKDALRCATILLEAGANVSARSDAAISAADSSEMVKLILSAGAHPGELSSAGKRLLLGLTGEIDAQPLRSISIPEFERTYTRRFGQSNPERMIVPFWEAMFLTGKNAALAAREILGEWREREEPVWCADRFGQSVTPLSDGRFLLIAGEHEDSYDPDFCIYNDVMIFDPTGRSIEIFGYPRDVFPPTDFHTATPIGNDVYVIGSLGYPGTRRLGQTPVYRLALPSLAIERLRVAGEGPGWIYMHRAVAVGNDDIRVWAGKVITQGEGKEVQSANAESYILNLSTLRWLRDDSPKRGPDGT